MKPQKVSCPACKKKVQPAYTAADIRFSCPKCGKEIPFSAGCKRKIILFRIAYHLLCFSVILLVFGLLYASGHTFIAVLIAALAAPTASAFEKAAVMAFFVDKNRYQLQV